MYLLIIQDFYINKIELKLNFNILDKKKKTFDSGDTQQNSANEGVNTTVAYLPLYNTCTSGMLSMCKNYSDNFNRF